MKTANDVLEVARGWLGKNKYDGSFKEIIDLYNSHKPLAVGYKVPYDKDWCDAFVSACAIKANAVDLIGTECGCQRHIGIWKNLGIWVQGSVKPYPGDVIVIDWDGNHNGYADHVGYVENVEGGVIYTIEGNRSCAVRRKQYQVGDYRIRGFAHPKYAKDIDSSSTSSHKKSVDEVANEVIRGIWGSGEDRMARLTAAGYNYDEVQEKVGELLNVPKSNGKYDFKQFVMDIQKAIGAHVDGVAGEETLSKTVTVSATQNRTHAVVRPLQKRLYAIGYTVVGKADGCTGPNFEKAVMEYQKDHVGYADGIITAHNNTWKSLLDMKPKDPENNKKEDYSLEQFVKDVQAACGARVDGIAGSETLRKTVTVSQYENIWHKVVLPVQKRLRALGYDEVGTPDGVAGTKFNKAVMHYQKDNGCYQDGIITARNLTWQKLLGICN